MNDGKDASRAKKYKNDLTESRCMSVLKLARFSPHCIVEQKKRANFKTNIHLDSVESFLYCLSSRININNEPFEIDHPYLRS